MNKDIHQLSEAYKLITESNVPYDQRKLLEKACHLLQTGVDMLNMHNFHGNPTVDRALGYIFFDSAQELIKEINTQLQSGACPQCGSKVAT